MPLVVRLAVIDYEACHPDKCGSMPCVRFCPVNRGGTIAIEPSDAKKGKPVIYEATCIACGICVKKCPFDAIYIVNLPEDLEKRVVHRYGENLFKLYGIPTPIRGKIVGILGRNGTGKSTALRILSGEIIPNLGNYKEPSTWDDVIRKFRGSEVYNYFRDLVDKRLRVIHKIQGIEVIPKRIKGAVVQILSKIDERGMLKEVIDYLGMSSMLSKDVRELSGGELQKLAVAAALLRDGGVYLFDEPSSYLDVRERLRLSLAIRDLLPKDSYVLVVEHDLAVLDYISDYVVLTFGEPGAYGYFSKPYATGAGIGHFLKGFLPAENMRIRDYEIIFMRKTRPGGSVEISGGIIAEWGDIVKKLGGFTLRVKGDRIYGGEVIGIVGPNAIGKTTFARILAGEIEPDEGYTSTGALRISYKPQFLSPSMFDSESQSVEELLKKISPESLNQDSWLYADVTRKLGIVKLLPRDISSLSGGELQKLAIAVTLSREADIYLLDEPSAHIDVEDRITVARAIKRVVENRGRAAIVIEHDVSIMDFIADRIMVFKGEPGVEGIAEAPTSVKSGMNSLLKYLDVTFRRDPRTNRPRINKPGSYLDRYQKSLGEYYYETPHDIEAPVNEQEE
ncbi:MAG: ribosome biogenesis/translation initiation ATPase RLI [Sulfolobales archaeon]